MFESIDKETHDFRYTHTKPHRVYAYTDVPTHRFIYVTLKLNFFYWYIRIILPIDIHLQKSTVIHTHVYEGNTGMLA